VLLSTISVQYTSVTDGCNTGQCTAPCKWLRIHKHESSRIKNIMLF